MDLKCTELLRQLKAYTDEIANSIDPSLDSKLHEDVSATVEVDQDSACYRLLKLLKELEAAAKISKLIRAQFQRADLDESENASTDAESFQETQLRVECPVEASASSVKKKTAESSLQTPLLVESPVGAIVSTDEEKTAESFSKTPLPIESPVKASTSERKTAASSIGNALSSELTVEQNVSIDVQNKGKIAEIRPENLDLSSSSIETPDERKTFRIMMDVSNFLPKEISVKIIGKYLVVHGEHEPLFDEHGKISRKFTRKFEVPEDVDAETFRALFDCYRVLTIEASFKTMKNKGDFDVQIYEETGRKPILSTFKDLGPGFVELADHYIKEAEFIRDFARNLAKQGPSNYIPIEEVIPLPM